MGKRKARGFDLRAPNQLRVNCCDVVSSNGEALPTESAPAQIQPLGFKSSKVEHLNNKVKEHALRANAKTTIDFADATLKKDEQIAQQNIFSLFTIEDKLISRDLARPPHDPNTCKAIGQGCCLQCACSSPGWSLLLPNNTTSLCDQ